MHIFKSYKLMLDGTIQMGKRGITEIKQNSLISISTKEKEKIKIKDQRMYKLETSS